MGVSVCVGSNFDARLRGVVQGLPELDSCVDSLVISSEVGYRKPHPSFFRAACDHLGLPPERVLCVGDDLENDVRGADPRGPLGPAPRSSRPTTSRSSARAQSHGAGTVAFQRKLKFGDSPAMRRRRGPGSGAWWHRTAE